MCKLLTEKKEDDVVNLIKMLLFIVDSGQRDLVYYGIGILINVTLHKECRVALLSQALIAKLTTVVRDCNIEDMDLAKMSLKCLLNLTAETIYWSED